GGDVGENCVNVTFPECTSATDCDDRNACTTESCEGGVCQNTAIAGCRPCSTAADCDDENPCTSESCDAGICHSFTIGDCRPCDTAAQCDDGDSCTTDSCTAGVCVGTSHCTPEVCDDGIDNDGDGLVDCSDPDCATFPACEPPHEICGNCIDDDGNGLTDFEDPACCEQSSTFPMVVKKGRLRPRGSATKLRLNAILARSGLAVNPLADDVFVQIRPDGGTDVFCARVPAAK